METTSGMALLANSLPLKIFEHLPHAWTFMLLMARFSALMIILPGIGGGLIGLPVRMSAIMVLSFVTLISGPIAEMPPDAFVVIAKFASELLFGFILGLIPAAAIAGVQAAAQLSSGTMGLGAAQLMDPTLGISVSSLGRIMADACVCLFLILGGHHAVIYAASGMGQIIPGTFLVEAHSVKIVVQHVGYIFNMAVMISAPVIVALLLTQFVMGLISKAVPSVNIFIVSFPLTIGIGLLLSMLALPEVFVYMEKNFQQIEKVMATIVESTQLAHK